MSDLTEVYLDLMMRLEQITGKGSTVEIHVPYEQFQRLCTEQASDRRAYTETGFLAVRELGLTNGSSTLCLKPLSTDRPTITITKYEFDKAVHRVNVSRSWRGDTFLNEFYKLLVKELGLCDHPDSSLTKTR